MTAVNRFLLRHFSVLSLLAYPNDSILSILNPQFGDFQKLAEEHGLQEEGYG
jgi:hypothetical protein